MLYELWIRLQAFVQAFVAALLAGGLAGLAQAADKSDDARLRAAIAGSYRSSANVARDTWRHPYETLTFFGIKPNMTVVELTPAASTWRSPSATCITVSARATA